MPVKEYAQEMKTLALALADFKNDPEVTFNVAINNLNQTLQNYEGNVRKFETQWKIFENNQAIPLAGQPIEGTLASVKTESLRSKMPLGCRIAYDYLLVELSETYVSGQVEGVIIFSSRRNTH